MRSKFRNGEEGMNHMRKNKREMQKGSWFKTQSPKLYLKYKWPQHYTNFYRNWWLLYTLKLNNINAVITYYHQNNWCFITKKDNTKLIFWRSWQSNNNLTHHEAFGLFNLTAGRIFPIFRIIDKSNSSQCIFHND